MDNELSLLATSAKNGDSDALAVLWERVCRYCYHCARRIFTIMGSVHGVELEDLYQSSFFAVVDAAKTFKPDKSSFLTHLTYYIKTEFANCYGYRSSKEDAIDHSTSLDAPIKPDDEESGTLLDLIPDGSHDIEDAEKRIYNEQLRRALESVIDCLPHNAADCIRRLCLDEIKPEQYASDLGISVTQLSKRKHNYLYQLRCKAATTPEGARLRKFVDDNTNWYAKSSLQAFNSTQTSVVEALVLKREELEKRYLRQICAYKE